MTLENGATHDPVIVVPTHEPAAVYRLFVPKALRIRTTGMSPVRRVVGRPEPLGLFLQDTEGKGPGLGVSMVRLPIEVAVTRFMRMLAERQGANVSSVHKQKFETGDRIELSATRGPKTLHQLGMLDNGRLFLIHALASTREWPAHRDALRHALTSFELGFPGLPQSERHVTAEQGPLAVEHPAAWTVLAVPSSVGPYRAGVAAIHLALMKGHVPRAHVRVKVERFGSCPPVGNLLAAADRELRAARYAPARTKRPLASEPSFADVPPGWLGSFECEAALGDHIVDLRYGFAWRDGVAVSLVGIAPPPHDASVPWLRMHAAFELAARTIRVSPPS